MSQKLSRYFDRREYTDDMAKRIIHQLIDDIDGSVLSEDDGETVRFSLEGAAYEIDLSDTNAEKLRAALQPYIDAARRVGSTTSGTSPRRRNSRTPDAARMRAWASENGFTVSERGRVPASVIDAYNAAHS